MGMSTHVVGFRPPDEKWNRMKAAWQSCQAAGVPPPKEVSQFFEDIDPGDRPGAEVDLGDACQEYSAEMIRGYEIDISKLPKDVRIIRVYNSW